MKQGQFSQEKIVSILHQAEKGEQTIQAICREHGITEPTLHGQERQAAQYASECAARGLVSQPCLVL